MIYFQVGKSMPDRFSALFMMFFLVMTSCWFLNHFFMFKTSYVTHKTRHLLITKTTGNETLEMPIQIRPNTSKLLPQNHSWTRTDLGRILQDKGARTGVELGVQSGFFSNDLLTQWTSCASLFLVDSWQQLSNYADSANVDAKEQLERMFFARNLLAKFKEQTSLYFFPMFTSEAANFVPSELDFVYVDARHDYCGVAEDIAIWWPKLRAGGLMGGHDYLTNREVQDLTPNQDWSLCSNGSVIPGAVKQAVLEFVEHEGLEISISSDQWPSWLVQKPTGPN